MCHNSSVRTETNDVHVSYGYLFVAFQPLLLAAATYKDTVSLYSPFTNCWDLSNFIYKPKNSIAWDQKKHVKSKRRPLQCVFMKRVKALRLLLIYILIWEQSTTLNELLSVCTLTFECALKSNFHFIKTEWCWVYSSLLDRLHNSNWFIFLQQAKTVKTILWGLFKYFLKLLVSWSFAEIWVCLMCFLVLWF